VKRRMRFLAFVLAVPLIVGSTAWADASKKNPKDIPTFGALRTSTPDEARNEALAWLKGVGKADATSLKAFDAIWAQQSRAIGDRIADTLALGDPLAAKLLEDARDPFKPAPTAVPAILKDPKQSAFYRSNLSVAYAKALSNRRVFEEALDALKAVKVEQTADPAAYLFHRAVAEHALVMKEDAHRSIVRLIEDAADAPDRYRMLSVLMALDMQSWKNEKDLGWIARKMDNIERRLELNRGGPQTQKIQKEVVARLDEIIKQLENQAKGD
jgi:hypothetical protein